MFIVETETEREQGRGRERGRHGIRSRLRALSCQHRAGCGAWTHGPQNHDLSQSWRLNRLSHPGAPNVLSFNIAAFCLCLFNCSFLYFSRCRFLPDNHHLYLIQYTGKIILRVTDEKKMQHMVCQIGWSNLYKIRVQCNRWNFYTHPVLNHIGYCLSQK